MTQNSVEMPSLSTAAAPRANQRCRCFLVSNNSPKVKQLSFGYQDLNGTWFFKGKLTDVIWLSFGYGNSFYGRYGLFGIWILDQSINQLQIKNRVRFLVAQEENF